MNISSEPRDIINRIAAAWLVARGHEPTDVNIVGEPFINDVIEEQVPQSICQVILVVYGIDLLDGCVEAVQSLADENAASTATSRT